MTINKSMWAAASVAAMLVTACGKKGGDAMSDTTAMRMDSTGANAMMSPDSTGAMGGMRDSMGGMTAMSDANILYMLDQANMADSAEGAIAATKGTSKDVRDFGKEMMKEHHDLRKDGQDLAQKLNITPVASASDQSAAEAQSAQANLNSTAQGPAWDKAYIDAQVVEHQKVLASATAAAAQAQNPELKDMIGKAASKVQKHLDHALELQKKLPMM